MACLDTNEVIELVAGTVVGERREEVLSHLDACESCRELVAAAGADSGHGTLRGSEDDHAIRSRAARGDRIGRYVVLEPIGAGAMGVVLAAYDPELDRRVALKLLRAGAGGSSGDAVMRMQSEARTLARLNHANVVAIHDVGRFGDEVFIAMELVVGLTLTAWLVATPDRPQRTLDVLVAAGEGLAAAHAAGVIHRDFKPDNVLVGDDGRVRVTDFGLARAAPADPVPGAAPLDSATQIGALVGTPVYMAPELLAGGRADERSDQFAYCVAAYEAVVGRRPFEGSDLASLRAAIAAGPTSRAGDGRIGAGLRAVILRGLRVDPEARWPSMRALLDALSHAQRRRRTIAIAIAAPLGVAAIGALAIRRDPPPCSGGDAAIAALWNDARSREVADAFVAADPAAGAAALAEVDRSLSTWRDRWARAHDEVCAATKVRGIQSSDVLDLRGRCLERLHGEVEALVALLANADATVVGRATEAVAGLPDLSRCNDVDALARVRDALPADAAALERGRDLQRELADAAARFALDLPAPGAYESIIARAEADGLFAIAAEAAWRLATASGFNEPARALYGKAAAWALAGGDMLALARAWIGVLDVEGRGGRLADAELAANQADAALRLCGDPRGLRGMWHHKRCAALSGVGRTDDALEPCARAVELLAGDPGTAALLGDARMGLGIVHYHRGEIEPAISQFEQAMNDYRGVVGDEHSLVDNARSNLAEVLIIVDRTDEALVLLRDVLTRRPGSWYVRDGIATVLRRKGAWSEAFEEDLAALGLCERAGGCPFWVFAGVGDDLLGLGNLVGARVYFERANLADVDMSPEDRARVLVGLAESMQLTDPTRSRALAQEAVTVISPVAARFPRRHQMLHERAQRVAALGTGAPPTQPGM